jgi:hypothetical protein
LTQGEPEKGTVHPGGTSTCVMMMMAVVVIIISNAIEQSPWKADSRSTSQEIFQHL